MKRILLIDDDSDLLTALKLSLIKEGFTVKTLTSCESAIEILDDFSPNLVLLDVNIGTEDGRTFCRQVRNRAESQHIPVILISGNEDQLLNYHEVGAISSLPKPFDMPQILAEINKVLAA